LLAEEQRRHDGDEERLHGLVHGHEHRSAAVDAPRLHRERHAGRHQPLFISMSIVSHACHLRFILAMPCHATLDRTHRVEDGEELGAGGKRPGGGVALDDGGDGEELEEAEEAGVGGDGQARWVALEHGRLQHQPAGPRQAVAHEVDAPQRPALVAAGGARGGHGGHHGRRGRAEDGGALEERDDGGAGDAEHRARHLSESIPASEADTLDTQRGGHGEGDGRDRVLDRRRERGRRVVEPQQVEALVGGDPAQREEEELEQEGGSHGGPVLLLEEVGERGEEAERDEVAVDGEDELADAHVERQPGHHVEAGVPELQRQHRHVQPRALRRLGRRRNAGAAAAVQAAHDVAHDRSITRLATWPRATARCR